MNIFWLVSENYCSTSMAKRKLAAKPSSDEPAAHFNDVFALDNVIQLRVAVDQAVYGDSKTDLSGDVKRAQIVEGLTTLGQMGLLTESDLEEAKKGYL